MIVGVFSPVINWCGGAEWVAINVILALKEAGHQVIVLSDNPLDQKKFEHVFNRIVPVDRQIIFPLRFFSSTNYHNIYTDAVRSLMLKTKCDILIDTFSNAILPGMDASYIHYPLLKRIETKLPTMRNKIFFNPYRSCLKLRKEDVNNKLIFANSSFTAKAIKAEIGVNPHILYPSVSNEILNIDEHFFQQSRKNNVVTIARITKGKNLEVIPYISQKTNKDTTFTIVGLLDSKEILASLLKLIEDLSLSNRVKILTNVNRDQLRNILLNSKVYLHTKVNEHFGISIIEAMAAGCIPVVHDSGGPMEFVPLNQRFRNISEAAEIIERTIDNWSTMYSRQVSESVKIFGENNFSKRFIDIFHSHFQ